MRAAVLVLATLAVAHGAVLPTAPNEKVATTDFLKRQLNILKLLNRVGYEKSFQNEFADYDIASHEDSYTNPKVVKEFVQVYKHGFLPKDAIFSLACNKTRYQTIKLFDLFFFAKDFDTFYKTACWARQNVNGGQFLYTLYVAVYHRTDCRDFYLPPVYEVFPYEFISAENLYKVYGAKMEGKKEYKFFSNNSGWENYWHQNMFEGAIDSSFDQYYHHTEDRLSYFREDVGLGDFFAQFSAFYPSWLNQEKYNKIKYFRRGELFYYVFQQLFARYALERYANNMPNTEMLFWDKPIKVGYNPNMVYPNGKPLFPRADNVIPEEFNPYGVSFAKKYEYRLYEVIDSGRMFFEKNFTLNQFYFDGTNYLGFAVQGAPESPSGNYYGAYFYKAMEALGFLSKTGSDRDFVTGAIGNFLTAPRDPAFYQFLHRFVKIFQHYKQKFPFYTQKDLGFEGVKIESFDVDKLVTYFDRFDFEVTNLLPKYPENGYRDDKYIARQFRLNYKPFTYRLTVTSSKSTDAMVRVFIGPKFDSEGHELSIEQARMAFVEFDRFPTKLTSGSNILQRSSKESTAFAEDTESFRSFYFRAKEALEKEQPFTVTESYKCGLPERFLLPKGWKSGLPFYFYAIVTPFEEKYPQVPEERYFDNFVFCGGSKYYDKKPYGFPFDRKVPFESNFQLPNMYFKDVVIYHKKEAEVNRIVDDVVQENA